MAPPGIARRRSLCCGGCSAACGGAGSPPDRLRPALPQRLDEDLALSSRTFVSRAPNTDLTARVIIPAVFSVLGGVRAGGEPVEGQIGRLLGILVADGRAAISTEAIAERLWGEDLPPTAETAVHVAVGRLRRRLEPTLRSG